MCVYKFVGKAYDLQQIVMELCEIGSLSRVLQENGAGLTEDVVASVCAHMVQALHYLHSKQLIHRDLKAENILLSSDGVAKLGTTLSPTAPYFSRVLCRLDLCFRHSFSGCKSTIHVLLQLTSEWP